MGDLLELAAKLTNKRREALMGLSGNWAPVPSSVSRQAVAGLACYHSELCEREWQDGCAQCTYYRLTEKGLAMQAALRTPSAVLQHGGGGA